TYGDHRTILRGRALQALAFLELGRQRHEQAAELCTLAMDIFRERGCRLLLMVARNNRSIALQNLGRFQEATADRDEAGRTMREYTRGRRFVMFKITQT